MRIKPKTKRKIFYGVILGICIISVAIAIYTVIFENEYNRVADNEEKASIKTQETTINEFNELFNNNYNSNGYDSTKLDKMDKEKELVYSLCSIQQDVPQKYNMKLNIPVINLNDKIAQEFNQKTQKIFVDGANKLLAESTEYTIYTVEFEAWVNNDILSLIVKSTQKEGEKSQKVIIQTYNIDLNTKKEITLKQLLEKKELKEKNVQKAINETIKANDFTAKNIKESGFKVYERNLDDEMYKIENSKYYFLTDDKQIYVIYPYGNENDTSEVDIVVLQYKK